MNVITNYLLTTRIGPCLCPQDLTSYRRLTGTPIACSMIMQPAFSLSGNWFVAQNGLGKTATPFSLSPVMVPTWSYSDAGLLATEGIYSSEDLDQLRRHLMYPSERRAIAQTVSAAINQDTYISDTSFFNHLITKEAVESLFNKFMNGLWGNAMTFGNIFSGIFGIMLIFKVLKWACDTVVHSKGLYENYGCGWQLMASSWDAMTTYFLSPRRVERYNMAKSKQDVMDKDNAEMVIKIPPSVPQESNNEHVTRSPAEFNNPTIRDEGQHKRSIYPLLEMSRKR